MLLLAVGAVKKIAAALICACYVRWWQEGVEGAAQ